MRKPGICKVSGKRAYDISRKILSKIKDVFYWAETCKYSLDQVLASFRDIYESAEWRRLPSIYKEYLSGYKDAMMDELQSPRANKILFVYEVDGEYLTTKECREKNISASKLMHKHSLNVWASDRSKVWFERALNLAI